MLRDRPSYQRRIARIKRALRLRGLSQTRAAMAVGYSPALVCQVLRMQSTSRPMLDRLETWLDTQEEMVER